MTQSNWSSASERNRVSQSIYDAKGQLRYTINEQGGVSERGYDAMGRVTHTLTYDQAPALSGRSDASLSAFKAKLSEEVQAGRVRSALSVYDALGRVEFELDAEGYVVQYQYNRHFEKSRKKVYVNNQALKAALEAVRREDAALDDGAAIRLALSRLSSPDALSAQLTEQLDTLNTQQARIERMTHALDQVSSEIAQTHADNGVLGDKLHAAAQRLQGLSQQASLEAARQSELAQRITGLQDDIRQEEQALIGQYQAEVTLAHTKVQEAKNALKAKPNDAVLKQALAMATKDEQAAKARLSTIESQISAHPFGDEAKAEAVNITPQTPSVGAFNPNPHRDDVKASAGLDDVDA
ncbi:hypothetical protein, partial [Vibrio tetraodonis]|uniref:hypothetical protein n=1 Tax=Vibrio tetraodonis TaxID=2231647 RepID=UPI001F477164